MDHLRQAIRLTPSFPDSYIQLAKLLGQQDRFRDAIAMLKSGLTMNSHNPVIGNEYAWLLATCPVTELHDAPQAIAIGEALAKATSRRDPHYLDTLAAAYADAGRFDEAVPVAREALSLAQTNNNATLTTHLTACLALYEKGQPFRLDSP
jgi:tetratricopeptide (TPR) repeat protein